MTFRDLLRHTAALYYPGKSLCSDDPYKCLLLAIEKGRIGESGYANINYAMFRVVLPFVTAGAEMKAAFEAAKCKNSGNRLNIAFSEEFRSYVTGMLRAVGVVIASFGPTSSNRAQLYNYEQVLTVGGLELQQGYLKAGPGHLKISAREYIRFLSALDRGLIVPKSVVRSMKSERLGFDDLDGSFKGSADLGPMFIKNGGCSNAEGQGCASQAIILPGDVQAYVTINSATNRFPEGFSSASALRAAYEAALR